MSAQALRTPTAVEAATVVRSAHVVRSFVARRTLRGGLLWGLVVGAYTGSSAFGYVALGSTDAERARVLAGFGSNPGLAALVGRPGDIGTVQGFTDWRATGIGTLVVAVWGLLTATRVLRGEEAAGRWELFVAGRTTRRGATMDGLIGLGMALVALFAGCALVTAAVGASPDVRIGAGSAVLFALAVTSGAAVFVAVGALAGRLVATRGPAAGLALGVFGVAFAARALGDAAPQVGWLADASPLGWVERVHALAHPRPLWLLPLAALVAVLAAATLALADADVGSGVWGDRDTAPARLRLLGGPVGLAVRLVRGSALAWALGVAALGVLYGSVTASAADAFASSSVLQHFGTVFTAQARVEGARLFAGVVFLVFMVVGMGYAAGAAGGIRREEALGLVDNLLVRRIGRARWLAGRAALGAVVTVLVPLAGAVGFALGNRTPAGLGAGDLVAAGVNAAAPGLLLLGLGVLTIGVAPRATARVGYGLLAWSFLVEMLASAVDLPEPVRATSLLHHVTLAPAVDVGWRAVAVYVALAVLAAAVGVRRFVRRDLSGE